MDIGLLTPDDAQRAHAAGEVLLLDVRETNEHRATWIEGATLLPMSEVIDRVEEIPTDRPLAVICRSGARSARVAEWLVARGEHLSVANVEGGLLAWAAHDLPYQGDVPT